MWQRGRTVHDTILYSIILTLMYCAATKKTFKLLRIYTFISQLSKNWGIYTIEAYKINFLNLEMSA